MNGDGMNGDGSRFSNRRALVLGLCIAVGSVTVTSCAATTYDQTLTDTTAAVTTTTLPTGTTPELLARLLSAAQEVSATMIDGGNAAVPAALVDSLWAAVRADVQSTHRDLIDGFDQSVDRINRAIPTKRVADVDKSTKNLVVLIDAYNS